MRQALKYAAFALVLLAGALLVSGYNAARWLKVADAPARADAIIVLAGRYERALHAADLYLAGHAPRVVLSEAVPDPSVKRLEAYGIRYPDFTEIQRRILEHKGVPADRIGLLGKPALSTADEAQSIAARFGRPGSSLIVVTSPSHVMRARMIVEQALTGRSVTLAVCATPYEVFPDQWWHSQHAAREVLLEWAKVLYFLAGGRFHATAEP